MSVKIEDHLPVVKYNGLNSAVAVDLSGAPTTALAANTTIGGSTVVALGTITSTAAAAFAVGANGATGPSFQVDDSTASQASGVKVVGGTATQAPVIQVISTGSNAGLDLEALGTGKLTLNKTTNTDVQIGGATGQADFQIAEVTGATGATATLVTVGAAANGPTTAAQDGWLRVKIAGTQVWLPVWK